MNTPAEKAVYLWLHRTYGIRSAFRYVLWKMMHLTGHTIQSIAKRLGRRPIWVHNRLSDGGPLDIDELALLPFSMGFHFEYSSAPMVDV